MKRTQQKKRSPEWAWIALANWLPIIRRTRAQIRSDIQLYRELGCEIRGPKKVAMP